MEESHGNLLRCPMTYSVIPVPVALNQTIVAGKLPGLPILAPAGIHHSNGRCRRHAEP